MKLRGLDKMYRFGSGPLTKQIQKNFRQNICNEIAINTNFHFPIYKSMEI